MDWHDAEACKEHIRTWSNERIRPDGTTDKSFPYPDKFSRSSATGELAERIRFALSDGKPEELEYEAVFLTEITKYGGYSEYTQDNFTFLRIECGEHTKVIEPEDFKSSFSIMLDWLDEAEEVCNMTPTQLRELIAFAKSHGWEGPSEKTEEERFGW